jgi:hypothetical protein
MLEVQVSAAVQLTEFQFIPPIFAHQIDTEPCKIQAITLLVKFMQKVFGAIQNRTRKNEKKKSEDVKQIQIT